MSLLLQVADGEIFHFAKKRKMKFFHLKFHCGKIYIHAVHHQHLASGSVKGAVVCACTLTQIPSIGHDEQGTSGLLSSQNICGLCVSLAERDIQAVLTVLTLQLE